MPLPDRRIRWALALLGLTALCVLGGVGTLLLRSGFARALNGEVESREVRREKHPGKDDAHFLSLRTGEGGMRVLCVGRELWEASPPKTTLAKPAWSRTLRAGDREHLLPIIPTESSGALPAFPLAAALAVVLLVGRLVRS